MVLMRFTVWSKQKSVALCNCIFVFLDAGRLALSLSKEALLGEQAVCIRFRLILFRILKEGIILVYEKVLDVHKTNLGENHIFYYPIGDCHCLVDYSI